jgi:hypothetical protein
MYFEEALKTELESIPGLSNKVYPLNAIEGVTAPYVVYIASEGVFDEVLDGYLETKEIACELHILSGTYAGMKDLTKQVLAMVKSFQRRVIGGTDGLFVWDVTYEQSHEEYIDDLFQYLSIVSITVRI